MEEFIMSFIKTIFSMLFSMTIPIAFFAVIAFGIYKLLKNIKIEDFNRGERKILQKDERINIIYQILLHWSLSGKIIKSRRMAEYLNVILVNNSIRAGYAQYRQIIIQKGF